MSIPRGLGPATPLDYSKFDNIQDSDDDAPMDAKKEEETKKKDEGPKECANCRAAGAKKRCTRCLKVVYCNRDCQVSDWKFHKRICEKPKKKEDPPRRPPEAETKSEDAKPKAKPSSSSAASAASAAGSSAPAKPSSGGDADELHASDDEDAEALREISKGYRYFARTLDEKDQALIGDIKPKKLEESAASASASAGVGSAAPSASAAAVAAEGSSTPTPISAADASTLSSASAWNSAGTFEERDLSAWFKERLNTLLFADPASVDLGDSTLVASKVDDWEGSASILILRGKPRRIYDLKFKLVFEVRSKEPAAADGDDKKDAKTPEACLTFLDVSNDCDGDFPTSFDWGKTRPKRSQQDAIRSAVGSASSGLHMTALRAIRTVIDEFMAL